ncbi:MAG: ABC transporter ATP-binding protein/permease [Erysipelotrichaceae bacterium]|nr:ABC transporter ATP-binding protein/permease [Erysipelotrichaceae bacterium]
MSLIVDVGIANSNLEYVFNQSLVMVLIALLAIFSAIMVAYFNTRLGTLAVKKLRSDVFDKIQLFSAQELDQFTPSSLITRSTNDINQIQMLYTMMLRIIVSAPLMAAGGFFLMLTQESSLSWIFLILVPAVVVFIIGIFTYAKPRFEKIQNLVDTLNQVARQLLSGVRVIRAFNAQASQSQLFVNQADKLKNENIHLNDVMSLINPFFNIILNGSTILIMFVATPLVANLTLPVGSLMAFVQYTMQVMFAFIMLSFVFVFYPRAVVSAQRLSEVLNTPLSIQEVDQPTSFNDQDVSITFDNVSFSYQDAKERVLNHLSFTIPAKTKTAIIGSTGSGKSTLVRLLPRFFDPIEGTIRFNQHDISTLGLDELRHLIGYIPQKASLFSGSIRFNLTLNNPSVNEEDLLSSIQMAQASSILEEKEHGLDAEVTQKGSNLSGGQKQRLAIARALAKHPKVLIFDDSFSALDAMTDKKVREALKALPNTTQIIVSQKISSIIDCDQIIVLDEGTIVGIGNHETLLKTNSVYKEIALSQNIIEVKS